MKIKILILMISLLTINIYAASKKNNLMVTAELGYYMPEKYNEEFKIERTNIMYSYNAKKYFITLELSYSDNIFYKTINDSQNFMINQLFVSLPNIFTGNDAVKLGRYNYDFFGHTNNPLFRLSLNNNLANNMYQFTNPIGIFYTIKSKNNILTYAITNSSQVYFLPTSEFANPMYTNLSFVYRKDTEENNKDFSMLWKITAENLYFQAGYLTGKLSSNDIAKLKAIDSSIGDSDKKSLWLVKLGQNLSYGVFELSYISNKISDFKTNYYDVNLLLNYNDQLSSYHSYSKLKYKDINSNDYRLQDKTQIVNSIFYKIKKEIKVGYEYIINKETGDFENNLQTIKCIMLF